MESNPTTVRGWLETLPEPLRSEALKEWGNKAESDKHEIKNLSWAIWNVVELYVPFSKRSEYWVGVHGYLQGNAPNNAQKVGYHVAKAAFGTKVVPQTKANRLEGFAKSQQKPLINVDENGKSTIGMSLQASVDGEHFVDVKLQNPSYVAISPERLAELERIEALYNERIELLGENVNPDALWEKMQQNADKAAKWDTFGPKMRYIINTFEDLEGLKV